MTALALAPAARAPDEGRFPLGLARHELSVSSIDASLFAQLRTAGFAGWVHSAFERAVNFQSPETGIVTLACRSVGNGPWTLLVDANRLPAGAARVNDPVNGDGRLLVIGDGLLLRLTGAGEWRGRLPAYPADESTLTSNLHAMKSLLQREGKPGGLLGTTPSAGRFALAASHLLQRETRRLSVALARGDARRAQAHARAIVGLGPGLTPSGDDFLVGMLAVLNVPGHPGRLHLPAVGEAIGGGAGSTNEISFAALSRAVAGAVPQPLIDLIEAVMHRAGPDLAAAVRRVLQIGSSSGTDIACGVWSAFASCARGAVGSGHVDGR
jgi:hypothetical protein